MNQQTLDRFHAAHDEAMRQYEDAKARDDFPAMLAAREKMREAFRANFTTDQLGRMPRGVQAERPKR